MEEHDSGESAVKCWIKSINAIDTPRAADSMTPPEQNRIIEQRRENKRLRMEDDAPKQTTMKLARK